jgi:hypothetical protein
VSATAGNAIVHHLDGEYRTDFAVSPRHQTLPAESATGVAGSPAVEEPIPSARCCVVVEAAVTSKPDRASEMPAVRPEGASGRRWATRSLVEERGRAFCAHTDTAVLGRLPGWAGVLVS